jgi:HSP20 family protein
MTLVKFNNRPKVYDSLLDELFKFPATFGNAIENSLHIPPTNIHETKDAYHLELNVPGRNKEDFKIQVDEDLLTISFEVKEEKETEEYKTLRREFAFKSFKRSFKLDENVDAKNIQAKYENGLLKLFVPKKEVVKEQPKEITVQ